MNTVEVKGMTLLPPKEGTCSECAVAHHPTQPHNQQSLYYQTKFYMENGRYPTWADAMAHCTPEIKAFWTKELAKKGVTV